MEPQGVLIAILILAAAFGICLYVPARLTRRAMGQVIRKFYEHEATGPEAAKTLETLGLKPPSFLEKISRPRDYKPNAIRILQQVGAIQMTHEGKLYLVEENLHESLRIEKNSLA